MPLLRNFLIGIELCLCCFVRLRLHEEWLEKERLAQEEFRLKCEREEAAQKRKEEEEVNCGFDLSGEHA